MLNDLLWGRKGAEESPAEQGQGRTTLSGEGYCSEAENPEKQFGV